MTRKFLTTAPIALLVGFASLAAPVSAQNTKSDWAATASTEIKMHPEYAKSLAASAYVWAYPMINMLNRKNAFAQVPAPGKVFGVLPGAPTNRIGMLNDYIAPGQNFIACPNQDVVYGLGFMDLSLGPVVMQIPDIGERFWVYAIYDQRTDQVGKLGLQHGTEPGFYLLVGPDWEGELPEGIKDVVRSPTNIGSVIPRLFMDDTEEDRVAIQPLINQIAVYPLEEFTGEMKTIDWANAPSFGDATSGGETKWVRPETFLEQLADIVVMVPPMPGEEAFYSQVDSLLAAVEKDDHLRKLVVDPLAELDTTLIPDFLRWEYNGKDVGNNWNRNQNNAEWGVDYYNRTATSRSNKFENRPEETQYFYTDYDINRSQLDGNNLYAVTFEAGELPPVQGFWSLTLYNEHHFFYPNDLGRYSLGTKNTTLQYGDDGALTLYVGNVSPGEDLESNWIPAPAEDFSIYLRAYWPGEAINDESWTPPEVHRIH